MGPNDIPQIPPFPRPQAPQPDPQNARLLAEAVEQLAKANVDAEAKLGRLVDMYRRQGMSYETIHRQLELVNKAELELNKIRKGQAEDLKRFASEYNLSFDQIRKMPIRDLAKNFEGLTSSLLKMVAPIADVGTAIAATAGTFKYVFDSLSEMNREAATFALSRGDVGGAVTPSFRDRRAQVTADLALRTMGYDESTRAAVRASLARQVRMGSSEGMQAMRGAGAIAKLSDENPAAVAERIGQALRSGTGLAAFARVFEEIRKESSRFGTSVGEAATETHGLYMSSRALGLSYETSKRSVEAFSGELNRGIMSLADLAGLNPARREFSQNAQFIAMMRASGQHIPGVTDEGSIVKAVGRLMEMGRTEKGAEVIRDGFRAGLSEFAKRATGGSADAATLLGMRALVSGNYGSFPAGLREAAVMRTAISPVGARITGAPAIDRLASDAAKIEGATAGLVKSLEDAGGAVDGWTKLWLLHRAEMIATPTPSPQRPPEHVGHNF